MERNPAEKSPGKRRYASIRKRAIQRGGDCYIISETGLDALIGGVSGEGTWEGDLIDDPHEEDTRPYEDRALGINLDDGLHITDPRNPGYCIA